MDTIKNYLENIFKPLPVTEEMQRLKAELLSDMEAKYHELRQSGQTENEAIGRVMAEFGSIDELLEEMGIIRTETDGYPLVTMEEAKEFLALSARATCLIGFGVSVIMAGVSVLIGVSGLIENSPIASALSEDMADVIPVVLMLLMVIPAIAMFIYAGTLTEAYKFIEKGSFYLEASVASALKKETAALKPKRTAATMIGVSLCIFSAVLLIFASAFGELFSVLGVSLQLLTVAVAVFFFITAGGSASAYDKLLKMGDYGPKKSERET